MSSALHEEPAPNEVKPSPPPKASKKNLPRPEVINPETIKSIEGCCPFSSLIEKQKIFKLWDDNHFRVNNYNITSGAIVKSYFVTRTPDGFVSDAEVCRRVAE